MRTPYRFVALLCSIGPLTFGCACSRGESAANTGTSGPRGPVPTSGKNPLEPGASRPRNPTCLAPERPRAAVELRRVFSDVELSAPVGVVQAPRQNDEPSGRFFVIEQAGHIRSFYANENFEPSDLVSSDLTSRAVPGPNLDERGLLGIALHPRFPVDPRAFLMFTTTEGGLSDQISSFTVSNGRIDPASEVSLITIPDPYSNHNGGAVVFGPDGYLYIGVGDGGDGGDPHGHGQNPDTLLGTILRIDVDTSSGSTNYAIPADNPYVDGGGAPEIYAIGLRNPWRISFDRELDTLWVGDVGQNEWEEVSIVERGGNYGWNMWEGDSCFAGPCSSEGMTGPVHVYANPPGNESRSVTGGYVYRGAEIPDLVGSYVYGDFVTGEVWRIVPNGDDYENHALLSAGFNISSFGEDQAGELYAIDYGGGAIYRFERGVAAGSNTLPAVLSLTGCVNPADPTEVTSAAVPYDVALPFWSDGVEKERYLALPDGTELEALDDGDLALPPSGVALKNFRYQGKLIETRLYVRHADGEHSGFSYAWRDDGSDADLVRETTTRRFGDLSWTYPGPNQCNQCHTGAAGRTLGLELNQLDIENSAVAVNQLDALVRLDMLSGSPRASDVFASEDADLEERARAYLHVNCSTCHRPGGAGRGGLDLRFDTPLADSGLCQVATQGQLGTAEGRIVHPGEPAASVLIERVGRRDENGMPPLASRVVDEEGVALLSEYVESLSGCP
jgi:uncharacterized repeat protein (TIGR03806 family)